MWHYKMYCKFCNNKIIKEMIFQFQFISFSKAVITSKSFDLKVIWLENNVPLLISICKKCNGGILILNVEPFRERVFYAFDHFVVPVCFWFHLRFWYLIIFSVISNSSYVFLGFWSVSTLSLALASSSSSLSFVLTFPLSTLLLD